MVDNGFHTYWYLGEFLQKTPDTEIVRFIFNVVGLTAAL